VAAYELEIRQADGTDIVLIELSGELDLTNVAEVERRMEELAVPGARVVLDLNRVTFLDSAALHLLFRLARRFGGRERFGIVLEPNALVARVLSMVGLGEVARIDATLDDVLTPNVS
jgi:stage II sporulation protein AA (anti-sigma F factor antagonist)